MKRLFPILFFMWIGAAEARDWGIDTSHMQIDLPSDIGGGIDYDRSRKAYDLGASIGEDLGLAIRASRERKRRETIQRVQAAAPLCSRLRSEILAGSNIALETCLGALLD